MKGLIICLPNRAYILLYGGMDRKGLNFILLEARPSNAISAQIRFDKTLTQQTEWAKFVSTSEGSRG